MKVFLGGTCNVLDYRNKLISMIKCEYYNPVVKNWTEEDRLREVEERKTADYILYVITNGIKGVYSIAEVVDDANKRPEKTLFLNLYNKDKDFPHKDDYRRMAQSLKAVENLLKENKVKCFSSLEQVANFLNSVEDKE